MRTDSLLVGDMMREDDAVSPLLLLVYQIAFGNVASCALKTTAQRRDGVRVHATLESSWNAFAENFENDAR